MKKILFISVLIFVAQLANAQLRHGIKLDGAFSTITGFLAIKRSIKTPYNIISNHFIRGLLIVYLKKLIGYIHFNLFVFHLSVKSNRKECYF